MSTSLLDPYYSGAINLLKISLRGARQCEAVLALGPSGKTLTTDIWILLASWHVALRLRLKLGGGAGGSVLVATPDSVHSTFID